MLYGVLVLVLVLNKAKCEILTVTTLSACFRTWRSFMQYSPSSCGTFAQ